MGGRTRGAGAEALKERNDRLGAGARAEAEQRPVRDRLEGRLPQAEPGQQGGGALQLDGRARGRAGRGFGDAWLAERPLLDGTARIVGRRAGALLALAALRHVGVEEDARR